MKNLCEQYIREKCDNARRWSLEAAQDEENGHHESAERLLHLAKTELQSAIREIDRYGRITSEGTVISPVLEPSGEDFCHGKTASEFNDEEDYTHCEGSRNPLGGLPDEQQAGYIG